MYENLLNKTDISIILDPSLNSDKKQIQKCACLSDCYNCCFARTAMYQTICNIISRAKVMDINSGIG